MMPAEKRPQVSWSIPCYNEEEVLRSTVTRLAAVFVADGVDVELVLVDNGSTDRTGAIIDELIAEGLPITKVVVETNIGYGNGVLQGLAACRGSLVGFICADGQVEPADVLRVYQMSASSKTPRLVKVRRRFRMDGLNRKVVSVAYNVMTASLFGGLGSIDVNGNPKIFPREFLDPMELRSTDWFLDAEVMIRAKQLGLEVLEFNVLAQARGGGTSNVRAETCWEFVGNLLRFRFGARPRPPAQIETTEPSTSASPRIEP
jgi:glycosyltransferase involved in cell wall biosynthesis